MAPAPAPGPSVDVVAAADIPSRWQAPLAGWLADIFGPPTHTWSPPDWCVLVFDSPGGELVSYLEMVRRDCDVGGRPVAVGGVSGVITRPAWRRRGYASAGLRRAARFLDESLGVDFGLLVCSEEKIPLYQRAGWQLVRAPLVFDQPAGRTSFAEPTTLMILPVRRRDWPPGRIDLCGLPW